MPRYLTLKAHPRAVIHNDAGVGKDEAGIAVIAMAEALGVAAATASHASCRIGDAADMMARGAVSHANAPAVALGVARRHALPRGGPTAPRRARPAIATPSPAAKRGACSSSPDWRRRIVLIDSASLIRPEDTGPDHRHRPRTAPSSAAIAAMALQVDGFAAVFTMPAWVRTAPALPACRHSTVAASPASRSRPPLRVSAMPPPSTRTASISHANDDARSGSARTPASG